MADFLLELFSEEIPARMQAEAARHLQTAFEEAIKFAGLTCREVKTYVTPRRLALICKDIPAIQPDSTVEKKGPKTNAPQAALDGFLRSTGLSLEALEKRTVGKDETYFAVIHQKGLPTAAVLQTIIEKILAEFPWPKSMRWGAGDTRWVRPLHSIACLLDNGVIPVNFAGITAGNITYGHRFLAPAAITLKNADEYIEKLRSAKVMADATERKDAILAQAEAIAQKNSLTVKPDKGLLEEVTGLVEWPTVLIGSIDTRFMDLPPEVLTSEMRAHQKYFALLDSVGNLAPKFLIVSNMITSDRNSAVIAGNERVLRARLSDGRFFWDQDRKKPLSEWAEGLKGVTFHAKIGTVAEKAQRTRTLAILISDCVQGADKKSIERAANLCKADLVTGMVGEFPELQGVMGRYYALHQKEDAAVADAIRDHYLPLGPDSPIPTAPLSACIALADKFDTLISMFAAGEKPTGSKDPFALRRSALGIIRIVLENNLRMPLKKYLNDELIVFFSDRLKVVLKDKGIRHDLVAAVMAGGDDDLMRIMVRAKVLQEFLGNEDGANLLAAYRRASNIVGIEEKKDKKSYTGDVNISALQEAEEKKLFEALEKIGPKVKAALDKEQFSNAMETLATLRSPLDAFFDKVMVNTEDLSLRANRLNLLSQIRIALDAIADFAAIEG